MVGLVLFQNNSFSFKHIKSRNGISYCLLAVGILGYDRLIFHYGVILYHIYTWQKTPM